MARSKITAAAFGLLAFTATAQICAKFEPMAQLNVTNGYTANAIFNGMSMPRGIVFGTTGNLLVAEQGGASIRHIVLAEDDDGNSSVVSSAQLIDDRTVRFSEEYLFRCHVLIIINGHQAKPRHRAQPRRNDPLRVQHGWATCTPSPMMRKQEL
ncbi:hypothetical protein F5X96DRAFT_633690 [Biscogniauxia mediterranea]|nr:hypothetical protein F5X96DRAFT_633690 [Biscogniauxia mediterranea]